MINIFPFHDAVLRDLAALNPDPALWESWSCISVRELAIRFGLVADEHHDALVAEFQDYQLSADDELPLYTADSRVDTFWADMAKKKTFAGAMRFTHLAHLITTLSVIAHSNAHSERVFSMCHKINTDARSQLGNDTLRALLSCKINMGEPCYVSARQRSAEISEVCNMELCERPPVIVMCRPLSSACLCDFVTFC
ncbi:hypothetical protein NP493_1299g00004 [Ridgeia piscesae]|uniref:HAT C-terminal dimerisation domain-containing protein n=1 Tax=Ridgeia piscesae TaxID=27915 RepID=A0AAD9NFP8_RIDPI|nr:hypothetical protein NP493_1299g00004 [Ridgeia piscesae]